MIELHDHLDERDGPRDECGVFGIYAPEHEVSRLAYFALYALQHRGQESAGIAAADLGGYIITQRALGLVNQVFKEHDLRALGRRPGHRPRPLLHDGLQRVGELPARPPLRGLRRQPPRARPRAQRQPDQRRRAARRAARAGRHVRVDIGLGDHRRAAGDPPGREARGRRRRRDAAPQGRLLDRGDDQGPRRRLPRPGRPAPARRSGRSATATASPSESCAFDIIGAKLLRDVAARRDRHAHARAASARARSSSASARRSASSSTSTSRVPTRG